MSSFVNSAIPQPFFELQTPDFAWKFVWIVQINYKSSKVQKVQKSTQSTKIQKTQKCKKHKSTKTNSPAPAIWGLLRFSVLYAI